MARDAPEACDRPRGVRAAKGESSRNERRTSSDKLLVVNLCLFPPPPLGLLPIRNNLERERAQPERRGQAVPRTQCGLSGTRDGVYLIATQIRFDEASTKIIVSKERKRKGLTAYTGSAVRLTQTPCGKAKGFINQHAASPHPYYWAHCLVPDTIV